MQVYCDRLALPAVNEKDVLRYARCDEKDSRVVDLMRSCIQEAGEMRMRLCYGEVACRIAGDVCDFGFFSLSSRDLGKNLSGCTRAVLFAATLGVEMDRLIRKYQYVSPARSLMMQALGTERIEAGCDAFCRRFAGRPRYSPGYGDVSLTLQKDFFALLECEKHLGLCLNESLLMSPSKSVTAFVGLEEGGKT